MAVFGALTLYIVAMAALFALRKREPHLLRPYRVPGYPLIPALALCLAVVCLVALTYHNPRIALVYGGILALAFGWFYLAIPKQLRQGQHTFGED